MAAGIAGVDGGGSRTRAALVDESGALLALVETGGCNVQLVGLGGLERLLEGIWSRLGATAALPLRSVCLALAGAGRRPEQEAVAVLVRRRGWAAAVEVVSDAQAALEGAHAGGPGVVAVAGTGSIVMGKNHRGERARAGGWGPLLGDEGSGYAIVLEALRAALRARDGWGEQTALQQELQEALDLDDWDGLVSRVYGGELNRERIAALSPHVFAAARAGDAVAARIVANAGADLGRQMAAVARRLGLVPQAEAACSGGVLAREREALWPAMQAGAAQSGVNLHLREPALSPVLGAVLSAWRQAGLPADAELFERLARSCPAAS